MELSFYENSVLLYLCFIRNVFNDNMWQAWQDFQRSRDGLICFEKYHNFTYVLSGMYLMTICGKNCNKTVYSYKNKAYVIRWDRQNVTIVRVPHPDLWPHKSLVPQDKVFLTCYGGTRWQIYKIKTTDISMLIIIHMQRKRKSYTRTLWLFFNIDFTAL